MDTLKKHPAWFGDGIVFVGNWEPLSFRRRSGMARTNEEELFNFEHSEKNLEYLRKSGVNLILTHFHKCFGTTVEKDEIDMTRHFIQAAHRHGIRVGTYIRFDNIADETYASEIPDNEEWIQRNHNGESEKYYEHDFRHRTCPNQENYIRQVEKLVRLAVGELKSDLVHFDGFSWGNKFACHCETCKTEFRKFLETRYPEPEDRKKRFGHDLIGKIDLPQLPVSEFPDNVINPVHQEWIFFRKNVIKKIHDRMSLIIKSLNPDAAVEFNALMPTEYNIYIHRGISIEDCSRNNDAIWTEWPNEPRIDDKGRIISRVREFKFAESCANVCFSYAQGCDADQVRRSLAETLAFNCGHMGMVGTPHLKNEPFRDIMTEWISFYRKHAYLYLRTESAAEVAILRHETTLTFNSNGSFLAVHRAEQLLMESCIPYRTIGEADLKRDFLKKFKLLVLADVKCLDNSEVAEIIEYVRGGGALAITGDTSLFDKFNRRREDYLLRELIGSDIPSPTESFRSFNFYKVDRRRESFPGIVCGAFGKGRILYSYRIDSAGADDGFWEKPANRAEWVQSLKWASGKLDIEIHAPRGVLCEVRKCTDKCATVIHLVNLSGKVWKRNVRICLSGNDYAGKTAYTYGTDEEKHELKIESGIDGIYVIVPILNIYKAVEIK